MKADLLVTGWGLVVCVFAMLAAAAVEWYRLRLFHEGKVLPALDSNHSHSILHHRNGSGIVDMNVFWQAPQYLLVGLSEVSTYAPPPPLPTPMSCPPGWPSPYVPTPLTRPSQG